VGGDRLHRGSTLVKGPLNLLLKESPTKVEVTTVVGAATSGHGERLKRQKKKFAGKTKLALECREERGSRKGGGVFRFVKIWACKLSI